MSVVGDQLVESRKKTQRMGVRGEGRLLTFYFCVRIPDLSVSLVSKNNAWKQYDKQYAWRTN